MTGRPCPSTIDLGQGEVGAVEQPGNVGTQQRPLPSTGAYGPGGPHVPCRHVNQPTCPVELTVAGLGVGAGCDATLSPTVLVGVGLADGLRELPLVVGLRFDRGTVAGC